MERKDNNKEKNRVAECVQPEERASDRGLSDEEVREAERVFSYQGLYDHLPEHATGDERLDKVVETIVECLRVSEDRLTKISLSCPLVYVCVCVMLKRRT